jgi:hypothetical protein
LLDVVTEISALVPFTVVGVLGAVQSINTFKRQLPIRFILSTHNVLFGKRMIHCLIGALLHQHLHYLLKPMQLLLNESDKLLN